ncbi:hypothetical protein G5C51_02830 [Streptomyces sp. A7024]|uniref:Uncharacterized protein n=1 Tax=Streptomyces coryli TaxID=1128680 RepID=A0A6G4TUX1_9ACTN|nr:hypothetical protein [Streptomyces coryli]NGN62837.1 hypothetical protein [Streptomyces coryli]
MVGSTTKMAPGGKGTQSLVIENSGKAAAKKVRLTYVTPVYVNVNEKADLPRGCRMKLADADPYLPQVVSCTLPRLAAGAKKKVTFPVTMTKRARFVGPNFGMGMARPVGTSDADPTDNWTQPIIQSIRPTPAVPQGHVVDLWHSIDVPPLSPQRGRDITFTFGNKGPDMNGPAQLVFVTPFYVNTDHKQPLPPGCSRKLAETDPLLPEVVQCNLRPIPAGAERQLRIPLTLIPGGPRGVVYSLAVIAPDNVNDVERDQTDNLSGPGALNIQG